MNTTAGTAVVNRQHPDFPALKVSAERADTDGNVLCSLCPFLCRNDNLRTTLPALSPSARKLRAERLSPVYRGYGKQPLASWAIFSAVPQSQFRQNAYCIRHETPVRQTPFLARAAFFDHISLNVR